MTSVEQRTVVVSQRRRKGYVIKGRGIEAITLPPNEGMELTGKSVTALARRRARAAPLLPAAHP